jgi:hypothetical protein
MRRAWRGVRVDDGQETDEHTIHQEIRTMKNSRYFIVGATLLLAALAGTSTTADAAQRLACRADAVARLLGNAPAAVPSQTCAR